MKIADEWSDNINEFLSRYRYQPVLTSKLDAIGAVAFDQKIVNEIVLWKVNRYAPLSDEAFLALNSIVNIRPRSHREAEQTLALLLKEPGVDLPMASTLLRFRNPAAFQIIDRHAYRAAFGEDYPLYSGTGAARKVQVYFDYLDKLFKLAEQHKVRFADLDRILYMFDKEINGKL